MKKIKLISLSALVFLGAFIIKCYGGNCDQLPKKYSSYNEAVNAIKSTHFKIAETINTSKSSWVRGAAFYSCDGLTGFFILKTDKKEYLYSEVPINIWKEFKNADSFGSYYNSYIKHRFVFKLN